MTSKPPTTLVVDLGKSAWRAAVHCGRTRTETSGTPGVDTARTGGEGAGQALAQLVLTTWQESGRTDDPDTVLVASTAIPPAPELDAWVQALRFSWPAATVVIAEDGIMSHAAALAGAGVCATIGTGTIVVGVDEQGAVHRVDGWGPDLGDRGSAFELGRAGLRLAFLAMDGVISTMLLRKAAADHLSGLDLQAANRLAAHPRRPAIIADFAKTVCDLASHDQVSRDLVIDAARNAARSVRSAVLRSSTRRVAVLGRLGTHPAYRLELQDSLGSAEVDILNPISSVLELSEELVLSHPYRAAMSIVDIGRRKGVL